MGQKPEIDVPIIATSPPQIEEVVETVEVPTEITNNGQRRSPPANPIKLVVCFIKTIRYWKLFNLLHNFFIIEDRWNLIKTS